MKLVEIPRILYGTAWKEAATTRLVRQAVSAGFTAIDTANQPKHYQEALVGDALAELAAEGIARETLFIQTKFTPADGQDSRIPYNPRATYAEQVRQSFGSTLKNLQTDYVDSYLLHGPYSFPGLIDADWEVWREMELLVDSGQVKRIGISNINRDQLSRLVERATIRPAFVQNRCFASRGWDSAVRELCRQSQIAYQGFSLLTANPSVVNHRVTQGIAARLGATPQQVIYRFSIKLGMIPLTGTTDPDHMREALAALELPLTEDDVRRIEALS